MCTHTHGKDVLMERFLYLIWVMVFFFFFSFFLVVFEVIPDPGAGIAKLWACRLRYVPSLPGGLNFLFDGL